MLSQLSGFLSHTLVAKDKENGAVDRGGEMPFDEVFQSVRNESRSSGDDSLPEADAEPKLEEASAADPSSMEPVEVGLDDAFGKEEEDVDYLPGLSDHHDSQEVQIGATFLGMQVGTAQRDGEPGTGVVAKDDNASTMVAFRRSIAPDSAAATEVSARGGSTSKVSVQPAQVDASISANMPDIQDKDRRIRSDQADTTRMALHLESEKKAAIGGDAYPVSRPGPVAQADPEAEQIRVEFRSVASDAPVRFKVDRLSENEASTPPGRMQDGKSPSASRVAETYSRRSVRGGDASVTPKDIGRARDQGGIGAEKIKYAYQIVSGGSASLKLPSALRSEGDLFEMESAARPVILRGMEATATDVAVPNSRGAIRTTPPGARLETTVRSGLDLSQAKRGLAAVRASGEVHGSAETSQLYDGNISGVNRLDVPMPVCGTIESIPDVDVSAVRSANRAVPKARKNTESSAQSSTSAMSSASVEAASLGADRTSKDIAEHVDLASRLRPTTSRTASLGISGHVPQSTRTVQSEQSLEPARTRAPSSGAIGEAAALLSNTNDAEATFGSKLASTLSAGRQDEPSAEVGHVVSGEVTAKRSMVRGRSKASEDNAIGTPPASKMVAAMAEGDASVSAPSPDPIGKLVTTGARWPLDPQLAKRLPSMGVSFEETVQVTRAGQVRSMDTIPVSTSISDAAPESGVETPATSVISDRTDRRETAHETSLVWQRSSRGTAAPQALGHPHVQPEESVRFFRHRPEQTVARASDATFQGSTPEAVPQTQSLRSVESGMPRENTIEGPSPQKIGGKIVPAEALPIRSETLLQCSLPAGSVLSPVLDDGDPEALEAGLGMLSNEARSSGSTAQAHSATTFHRTETATSVLRQMIEGVTTAAGAGDDVIELQLRPEELGHLRFRMVQGEHGLLLNISADRPETLDLLRRHVDQLARSLSDLGYGGASFSFGEGGQSNGQGGETGRGVPTDGALQIDRYQDIETPKTTASGVPPSNGLDIRI